MLVRVCVRSVVCIQIDVLCACVRALQWSEKGSALCAELSPPCARQAETTI